MTALLWFALPFALCIGIGGPGVPASVECDLAYDRDGDGDVDLRDFQWFQSTGVVLARHHVLWAKTSQIHRAHYCGWDPLAPNRLRTTCLTGPGTPLVRETPSGWLVRHNLRCPQLDLDGDGDYDLRDYAGLERRTVEPLGANDE